MLKYNSATLYAKLLPWTASKRSGTRYFHSSGAIRQGPAEEYNMEHGYPAKVPMPFAHKITMDLSGEAVDQKLYRGRIIPLLYLTASIPDIMFATCLCARYQANPKASHLTAVKKIFRYLRGTHALGGWCVGSDSQKGGENERGPLPFVIQAILHLLI